MSPPRLRDATPEDEASLAALWTATGIGFGRERLPGEIAGLLGRDPGLFLVVEADGVLAAAVMGTYDERPTSDMNPENSGVSLVGRPRLVSRLAVDRGRGGRGLAGR